MTVHILGGHRTALCGLRYRVHGGRNTASCLLCIRRYDRSDGALPYCRRCRCFHRAADKLACEILRGMLGLAPIPPQVRP